MVVSGFPLAKLGFMGLRQVSKPVANLLKQSAKRSHVFRNYVCIPTAHLYHWSETTLKMILLGLGKPVHVAKMNEQMAVELGADILGEVIIFGLSAVLVTYEVTRNMAKSQAKEEDLYARIDKLEQQIEELNSTMRHQSKQVDQLKDSAKKGLFRRLIGDNSGPSSSSSSSSSEEEEASVEKLEISRNHGLLIAALERDAKKKGTKLVRITSDGRVTPLQSLDHTTAGTATTTTGNEAQHAPRTNDNTTAAATDQEGKS